MDRVLHMTSLTALRGVKLAEMSALACPSVPGFHPHPVVSVIFL